jgi:hypothetical protein
VHLVVAPAGPAAATATAVEVLGLDRHPARRPGPAPEGPRDLSPAAVDVARRVNAVLGVRVSRERHAAVLARLVRLLATCDSPCAAGTGAASLTVPAFAQEWAERRAARMVRELTDGGYPVHGSVARLLPRGGALATHPRRADALEVVTACLARAAGAPGPHAAAEGAVRR